jgi:hypothetical protein
MTAPALVRRGASARRRGSLLISAMLISTVVGIGLVGYINLSANSLRLAQRTFYLTDAANLAEAGLEEAAYCFRLMEAGTAVNTVWTDWTVSGSNASITLPPFARGQSAVGIVKVYVTGYNGSVAIPSVYSQATITPLDGTPPITKTLKMGLKKRGAYNTAIVTTTSLNLGSSATVDSFNSNPTGASGATPLAYPGNGAAARANVIALGGTVSLGSHGLINGDLSLAPGVTAPPQSQVNGSIIPDYNGTFPMPTFPTIGSITRGYLLLTFPATLPRSGDSMASDGRYYYFAPLGTLGATTITAGANVTLVPLKVTSGLTIQAGATCIIYTLGTITTSGSSGIVNQNWAGALQIFTWTTGTCDLAHNSTIFACVYAPYAEVRATGGGSNPSFVGSIMAKTVRTSAKMAFHYDEALQTSSTVVGLGWTLTTWYDLQGSAESAGLAATTGGFLL